MLPDIKLRLRSVISSLEQCISHAIPADDQVAQEQLALITNTIAIAINQYDYEGELIFTDIKLYLGLIDSLIGILPSNASKLPELFELKSEVENFSHRTFNRQLLEERQLLLGRRIQDIVNDLAAIYSSDEMPLLYKTVIEHSEKQAFLYRAWVADFGFDLEKGKLPAFDELFKND